MAKVKETVLKAAREKVIYEGNPIRLSANFSAKTLKARRDWHALVKVLKEKKTYNLGYSTQQYYHVELNERQRSFQTSKN